MKPIIITAENLQAPFEFSGPTINIAKFDKITLHSAYIECSYSLKPCLIDIATTITDKTVGNPERSIASYYHPSTKRAVFIKSFTV